MFSKVDGGDGIVTRSKIREDVVVPCCRLEMSKGNIRVRGLGYYNEIGKGVRKAKTVKVFTKSLKQEYLARL